MATINSGINEEINNDLLFNISNYPEEFISFFKDQYTNEKFKIIKEYIKQI